MSKEYPVCVMCHERHAPHDDTDEIRHVASTVLHGLEDLKIPLPRVHQAMFLLITTVSMEAGWSKQRTVQVLEELWDALNTLHDKSNGQKADPDGTTH